MDLAAWYPCVHKQTYMLGPVFLRATRNCGGVSGCWQDEVGWEFCSPQQHLALWGDWTVSHLELVNQRQPTCFWIDSPTCGRVEEVRAAVFSSWSGILTCLLLDCESFGGYSSSSRMEPLQIWVIRLLLICILMASLKKMQIAFQTKDITTAATVVNDPVFDIWHCHTHLQVYSLYR